jgi:hypothetical protein
MKVNGFSNYFVKMRKLLKILAYGLITKNKKIEKIKQEYNKRSGNINH